MSDLKAYPFCPSLKGSILRIYLYEQQQLDMYKALPEFLLYPFEF